MKNSDIKSSEITEHKFYLNRRLFLRGAAIAGSVAATGFLYRKLNPPPAEIPKGQKIDVVSSPPTSDAAAAGFKTSEPLTPLEDITNYNNFYEFSTEKRAVATAAKGFVSKPWTISVEGLVNKPKVFDLDELLKIDQEERVYRLRCVEGWSMVIPWIGFLCGFPPLRENCCPERMSHAKTRRRQDEQRQTKRLRHGDFPRRYHLRDNPVRLLR